MRVSIATACAVHTRAVLCLSFGRAHWPSLLFPLGGWCVGMYDLGEYLIDRVGANPDIKNYYGLNAYEGLGLKAAAAPK